MSPRGIRKITEEIPNPPNEQVTGLLAPESEEEFQQTLAEPVAPETTERKPRADKGKPRKKAVVIEAAPDPRLDRARSKFASLGGGTAFKKFFDLIEKPLDSKEEEDVDDYFYLLSKKASLDPSESWMVMIFCALLLVFRLIGSRSSLGSELKKSFGEKKKLPEPETETEPDYEFAGAGE